jgi:hypothetical protein
MSKNLSPTSFNVSGEGRETPNKHDYKKNPKYLTQGPDKYALNATGLCHHFFGDTFLSTFEINRPPSPPHV